MPKLVPTFEEFQDAVGPEAMNFFMDMVNQDDSRPGEEESSTPTPTTPTSTSTPETELRGAQTKDLPNAALPKPQTPGEAKRLPKETHFVDPKGRRRKR